MRPIPSVLNVRSMVCVQSAAHMQHGTREKYVTCAQHAMRSMLHAHVHSMIPVHSILHAASISPSASAYCGTSTSKSAACTSRVSCPDTHGSDGHKMHQKRSGRRSTPHSTRWSMPLRRTVSAAPRSTGKLLPKYVQASAML